MTFLSCRGEFILPEEQKLRFVISLLGKHIDKNDDLRRDEGWII